MHKRLTVSNTPLWLGTMKSVFGKSEKKKSEISSDLLNGDTCVYSTLKYIDKLAEKAKRYQAWIFDQALWWKSMQVLL